MKQIVYSIKEIEIISKENEHFFFGYYDLQPYDSKEERHLAHRTAPVYADSTKMPLW